MFKNVLFINEKNKNKKKLNSDYLESFDSKEISLVLASNPMLLMKYWMLNRK